MFKVVRLDNFEPPVGPTTLDLTSHLHADFGIPVWVSMAFWVVTEDILAIAEGFTIDLNYIDPTGQSRVINGTPFSLGNAAGFSVTPVTPIQRQSDSSLVELVANRSGAGLGSPIVAARIMLTTLCNENVGFVDW